MKSTKIFIIAIVAILLVGITTTSCGSRRSAVEREVVVEDNQETVTLEQLEEMIRRLEYLGRD